MRVNINHGETTTGMFSKTTHYTVTVHVQFSEEELHVIKSRKLEKDVVMERGVPSTHDPDKYAGMEHVFHLTIDRLTREADTYALPTPIEAKGYEAELTNQLKLLKQYIDGNAGVEQQSTSFEL